jgi:peptidoglycan/LPS O-acetylase OafA/YrhL
LEYRKDIQILRGMSVVFIVLFHLSVRGFRAGFLGVDVFFVISGFLMALLYKGRATDFYQRRARRILPAYYTTVVATLLVCAVATLPSEFYQVVGQALFASVFASNFGFWIQNSYFSKAEFSPLLHLWSLGVEIQFYLIVPLLFSLSNKFRLFVPVVAILSFLICVVVAAVSPKTSFFMMPLRLWEFMIGYFVALYFSNAGRILIRVKNSLLGGICFLALLAIPFSPVNGAKPALLLGHPGLAALGVCVATGGVLTFGLPAIVEKSGIGNALELIGKYSYSIYLVHYPVIVLWLYKPFSGTILSPSTPAAVAAILALIAILSFLLYYGAERAGAKLYSAQRALVVSVSIIALSLLMPQFVLKRFSEPERKIFAAWTDRAVYRCGKLFRLLHPKSKLCELTNLIKAESGRLLLVGDSHADAIKVSFARVAAAQGYRVFFTVDNDPLSRGLNKSKELLSEAKARNIDAVFFHFSSHARLLEDKIDPLIAQLAAENIRAVLLMPVPHYDVHIPAALYYNLKRGDSLPTLTLATHREANKYLFDYAKSKAADGLAYYDLASELCRPECRLTDQENRPLFFDKHHLTLTGAAMLEGIFTRAINELNPSSSPSPAAK